MDWLTMDQVSALLNCSRDTVERRVKKGQFKTKQVAGKGGPGGKKNLIALSSLPPEIIRKYLEEVREAEVTGKNACPTGDQVDQVDGMEGAAATDKNVCPTGQDMAWLSDLTPAQQEVITFRAKVVREAKVIRICGGKTTTVQLEALAKKHGVQIGSVYRWGKISDWGDDLSGLVPKDRKDRGSPRAIHPEAWTFALAGYSDCNKKPSIKETFLGVCVFCEKKGITAPNYYTLRRNLKAWGAAHPQQSFLLRNGVEAWENAYGMYIPRDTDALAVNEIWMLDHSPMDMFCAHPKTGKPVRPWVTACMDVRSRVMMGHVMCLTPSSQTIARTLRAAITREEYHGIPQAIYVDNGKDFRCKRFDGTMQHYGKIDVSREMMTVISALNIRKIQARPYRGQSKAQVERWFGTIERGFVNMLPGYAGHDIQSRPRKKLKEQIENGELLSFEETKDFFVKAVDAYHHRKHRGLSDQAPLAVFYDLWDRKQRLARPEVLDLLLMKKEDKKITRDGIRIEGQIYYRYDETFAGAIGQRATVGYDPDDPTYVVAWVEGKCIGRVPIRTNVAYGDAEMLSERIAFQKREAKMRLKQEKEMMALRAELDTESLMMEGALRHEVEVEASEPEEEDIRITGLEKDAELLVDEEAREKVEADMRKAGVDPDEELQRKWLGKVVAA
jgi:putative transposase